jgi:F-type H+-transporting ATPase subunit a
MMQEPNIGEMVLHHTADAYSIGVEPFFSIHWSRWPDLHLGPFAVNLTPTKHVFFLVVAAVLVFITMRITGKSLERQRAHENAPKGFANAIEAMVLFVRDDMTIANIGPDGARYAPYIMSLFFFILYANVMGLIPHGATPTGNVAVTGALALVTLGVVEIGGFLKLGPKGYLHTIFPQISGLTGGWKIAMPIIMAPIEIIGKLVKPFALCVRLFGNMTAGHFVILSLFGVIFLFGRVQVWNWGIGGVTALLVVGVMCLELFVALLQAYIFALLSAVFIGLIQHEH